VIFSFEDHFDDLYCLKNVCKSSVPGPLVLGKGPLNALTPTSDMDRTVLTIFYIKIETFLKCSTRIWISLKCLMLFYLFFTDKINFLCEIRMKIYYRSIIKTFHTI